ncbi:MAG TPA: ParB N-terminal domain-containing protein [Candidatus Limnocylindrales bacterium]|nr:ParB N-terminal domain-containing protein [Candidatus Limnocylindrales bacterium]
MGARKTTSRKKKKGAEPASRGLTPRQICSENLPAAVARLAATVESDGGTVAGAYRDPLGGLWQLVVALPIDKVAPTPFQRDVSEAHVERLSSRVDQLGRFLDPIIAVRRDDGTYWTPNGNHRLNAMRRLGARSIVALLVPESDITYQILALNTEKAHNLREKALEVIRMARDLAATDAGPERDFALMFEEPALLTLGICYERNGRFAGSVYRPVLTRTESFLASRLPRAITTREARAEKLLQLDEAVTAAVASLKSRGFESPYLKNFVVARINPLRFQRGAKADFDATLDRMIASARRFDASRIKADQVARSGGPPEE